jgi:ribosomal protein S27E
MAIREKAEGVRILRLLTGWGTSDHKPDKSDKSGWLSVIPPITSFPMSALDVDILHPSVLQESQMNKKHTLVPNPRSGFVSLKCTDCLELTTAFSHSDIVVSCAECGKALAFPTGGQIRLSEGVQLHPKANA